MNMRSVTPISHLSEKTVMQSNALPFFHHFNTLVFPDATSLPVYPPKGQTLALNPSFTLFRSTF